jgi:type I restriction enzyme M protein
VSNNEAFSRQLRQARSRLHLSQEELAARLNVSFATVNRWEAGKSKPQNAQMEALTRLLQETGVADGGEPALSSMEPETPAASTRRRRGVAASKVLGNKPMEQMLWDAACKIRGEKDAPKFKDYLLPILFLKRLSDVFDDEVARLRETYGDAETARTLIEADHSLVRFYLPPEARWPVLSGREQFAWPEGKRPATLGEHLTTACRIVARQNQQLIGIIDQVDFNHVGAGGEREISDTALRGIIEALSDPRYRLGLKDVEPDFLGRCYEYLLRKFAEGSGQSAGEFFTPTEVGFLMAEILRPRPGENAYDYACGSAGLLIKLQLVAERLDPAAKKVPLKLFGQELQAPSYAIAWMNVIIHDLQAEIVRGDSMRNPKFRTPDATRLREFPLIVANPMWNQGFDPDVFEHDAFDRFERQGGTTTGKGDWAWLQHTAASLAEGGRAAVVLDTGAVSRGSGSKNEDRERSIRRWFVEHDLIEGIVLLPDNLFYNTTANGVIVFLRRGKPKDRAGRIVLVNASGEAKKGSPKNYLPMEAVKKVSAAYHGGADMPGFVKVITTTEAATNDYNLSPSRYVSTSGGSGQARDLSAIIAELKSLDDKAANISAELNPVLTALAK